MRPWSTESRVLSWDGRRWGTGLLEVERPFGLAGGADTVEVDLGEVLRDPSFEEDFAVVIEERVSRDHSHVAGDVDPHLFVAVERSDVRSDIPAPVFPIRGESADPFARPGLGDLHRLAVTVDDGDLRNAEEVPSEHPDVEGACLVDRDIARVGSGALGLLDEVLVVGPGEVIAGPAVGRDVAQDSGELARTVAGIVRAGVAVLSGLAVVVRISAPHHEGEGQEERDGQQVAGHGVPRVAPFSVFGGGAGWLGKVLSMYS